MQDCASNSMDLDEYISREDIPFEYDVVRERDNPVAWSRYLSTKRSAGDEQQLNWIYLRCLQEIPDNWEIWREFLNWRIKLLGGCDLKIYANEYDKISRLFQQCLKGCERSVDAWIMYLKWLLQFKDLKKIRLCVNEALRSLEWEFHERIWRLVFDFISDDLLLTRSTYRINLDDTLDHYLLQQTADLDVDFWSSNMLIRYAEVCDDSEPILSMIPKTYNWAAVKQLYDKLVVPNFQPVQLNKYELYQDYITALVLTGDSKLLCKVISHCLESFPFNKADLQISLVLNHIYHHGQLSQALDILENIISTTQDIREFATVYDFWVLLEERLTEKLLSLVQQSVSSQQKWAQSLQQHLQKLSDLIEQHPLRLNDLSIRQDPNNVKLWLDREKLFSSISDKAKVFSDAILTIDVSTQTTPGSLSDLWCAYCKLFEKDPEKCRSLLDTATNVSFKFLLDLENIWLFWAQYELAHKDLKSAINVLDTALRVPKSYELLLEQYQNGEASSQAVLFSSTKLWSYYFDLLEAEGEFEKIKGAYETSILIKVATPIMFINYSNFLKEEGLSKESLSIYERAIEAFPAEASYYIWECYIKNSLEMHLSKEHMRDIFDSAIKLNSSAIDCLSFYVQYSEYELKYGSTQHSVDILHKGAIEANKLETRYELWGKCLARSLELLGLDPTRDLYEECIQVLPNSKAIDYLLDFVKLEESNNEYARARMLLDFGSKLLAPSQNELLWELWRDFETAHGNKDTFKDMLRTKRYLEDTMKVDTEMISKQKNNVEFVSSITVGGQQNETDNKNSDEIDLEI